VAAEPLQRTNTSVPEKNMGGPLHVGTSLVTALVLSTPTAPRRAVRSVLPLRSPCHRILRVNREDMERVFRRHRDAEAARDYHAILETFVEHCFLETIPLGLRSEGRAAARAAYEGYFRAFPDLNPDDEGIAFGNDVIVVWGTLRGTSGGDWLGVPPTGKAFSVPFANVAPFRDGLMAGETIYFDLATLCEQAGLPMDELRAAARVARQRGGGR
jgi:steroid delta-isomerase-like uncharacterized protein